MKVTVYLHTILQIETPEGTLNRLDLALPQGSTVANLLDELEVELDLDALLVVVNGRIAGAERILLSGDQVNLMPAISGGS